MGTTSSWPARAASTGLLAAVLGGSLLGCGDEAETPTSRPSGTLDHDLVTVVSATLGGGTVDGQAIDLTGPGGVGELVAGLESGMPAQVRRAVRRAERRAAVQEALDAGARLHGAVVWIGCESPEEIVVMAGIDGPRVRALVPGKGTVQCLAPVTSVAIFTA
jgi:hypothetical protein